MPCRTRVFFVGGTLAFKVWALPFYYLVRHFGAPSEEIDLPWGGLKSLEANVQFLLQQIESRTEPGDKVVLIGHSQAGLLVFAAAAENPAVELAIALNAPFEGSVACTIPGAGFVPAFKDMSPNSDFLKALPRRIQRSKARFLAIRAPLDLIVYPSGSCHCPWPGVENERLSVWVNHLTGMLSPTLWRMLREAVQQCEAGSATTGQTSSPRGRRRTLIAS